MKTIIIQYFKTDRSFRGGVSLIHRFSPKLGLKKQLNIHPESDYLKGCVIEELRELADISAAELKAIFSVSIPKPLPLPEKHSSSDLINLNIEGESEPVADDQQQSVPTDSISVVKGTQSAGKPIKKASRKK